MGIEQFSNTVKVEWVEGSPRNMRLLEDVDFTDSKGKMWRAYKDKIINGASIPRILWTSIGSPYVGKYRRASVLHDVHCETKEHPYREIHYMFYEAMRADGVRKSKAKVMYAAVMEGGPKW